MRCALIESGVVANVVKADPDNLPDWIAGYIQVADDVGPGFTYDGSVFTAPTPPAVTPAQVDSERERRLIAGTDVAVTGAGTISVQGRDVDRINLLALMQMGSDLVSALDTTTLTTFRAADNSLHDLTGAQLCELVSGAQTHASAIYQASWVLKDATPIPQNYTDDIHWP